MEAINLCKSEINSISTAFMSDWGKIFGCFDSKVILGSLFYCGILPVEYNIDLRKVSFLDQIANCHSVGLKNLF